MGYLLCHVFFLYSLNTHRQCRGAVKKRQWELILEVPTFGKSLGISGLRTLIQNHSRSIGSIAGNNIKYSHNSVLTFKFCFASPVSERTAEFSRIKTFIDQNQILTHYRNFSSSSSKSSSSSSSNMSESNGSNCRQNYHESCEALVNKQINLELYASYVYMSMVSRSSFS